MLKLVNITKDYKVADMTVRALKGVSLSFRRNEFVSVLGPSGCGKTTLLNIVGGLDKYTSGDLIISGRSTKEFKDRDWDVYRNHRVGFVFQSYNLIPHQTVLGNVELALTIAGMSKDERVRKAKLALDKVGLSDQYYKRPNQLSGGQCQRVAIARALVNDPEILLADEPTGALDTTTSKQIMDLIKEIAGERLVIMVTHNPELAEEYSTRIIRLLDGELLSDTNPMTEKEEKAAAQAEDRPQAEKPQETTKKEKAKMSFWTAFRLSLQNLFTKKARTIMTSIAGSIGIIGISLVLSISYGVQGFINDMQNDMLSGNPIEITRSAFDINALMSGMSSGEKQTFIKENGWVNVNSMIQSLVDQASGLEDIMIENDITQDYVDYISSMPKEYVSSIMFDYGLDVSNSIYTDFYERADSEGTNMSLTAIKAIYTSILGETEYEKYSPYIDSLDDVFAQALNSPEYILSQYNLLDGDTLTSRVAEDKSEIMIVLGDDRDFADLLLAQLGYYNQDEFINLIYKATGDEKYDETIFSDKFSYDDLIGKTFTWYPNDTIFTRTAGGITIPDDDDTAPDEELNPFRYNAYSNAGFEGGLELTVVGILEPKENLSYGSLSSGFYYTEALANHIIEENMDSIIVEYLTEYFERNPKLSSYTSGTVMGFNAGVTFSYTYTFPGNPTVRATGFVGKVDQMSSIFGSMMGGDSSSYYALNLQQLGGVNLPGRIAIYPVDFGQKDYVLKYLDKWNAEGDIVINGKTLTFEERSEIKYTDFLSLIISMLNTFIQMITIALIGFTALSLVVSTVMIAIITYVSVVERIKEIGVIRSLGGRKRDVSYLFNAETFIIGLTSGIIGIIVTYLLSGLINVIVSAAAGITAIAVFPWHYALIMLGISILLTLISGFIPSRSAAKKDPVVALRTE